MKTIRQYALAHSLTWLGVYLVFDKSFKNNLGVIYFTKMIQCSNGNRPVNKSIHCALDNLAVFLRDASVMNQWINSDTMC